MMLVSLPRQISHGRNVVIIDGRKLKESEVIQKCIKISKLLELRKGRIYTETHTRTIVPEGKYTIICLPVAPYSGPRSHIKAQG
jgi:hypothetical protein